MTVPFPNPTTFEEMQANRQALKATFFPAGALLKRFRELPVSPPERDPIVTASPVVDLTPASKDAARAQGILEQTARVAELDPKELLSSHKDAAVEARRIAAALLTLSCVDTVNSAADRLGVTPAAVREAARSLNPVILERMLPVLGDPISCVSPLWEHRGSARVVELSVADCLAEISRVSGYPLLEIKGERRAASLVKARQIGMWVTCRFNGRSLPEVGRHFGDRDHTTVLHARRKVDRIIECLSLAIPDDMPCAVGVLWQADWNKAKGH